MNLHFPELSLLLLVGSSGSGKSSFARKHFLPTEVLSSDFFRGMISDDQGDQRVSPDAFAVLHLALEKRLKHGRFTVLDTTHLKPSSRKAAFEYAQKAHVPVYAIVFDLPQELCQQQNLNRPDRVVESRVVTKHHELLQQALKEMQEEGFKAIHRLSSKEEVDSVVITRSRLSLNQTHDQGPFDIIGDVHGCLDELLLLLNRLGYTAERTPDQEFELVAPAGRKLVFVGDLVDRGPQVSEVLKLVMAGAKKGIALSVMGNHDHKLFRKLRGSDVQISHGLSETLKQFESQPPEFLERVRDFLATLPFHLIFDDGKLLVAHAGLKAELHGRTSDRARAFPLFGETTGETDEFGLPIRGDWWSGYDGKPFVVYGHTPIRQAVWINRCLCIDTACVFGHSLTALRYPEMEIVSVPAAKVYAETKRIIPQTLLDPPPQPLAQ
jgi:protein phosphatase